jgi:hypothetical protein
MGFFEANQDLTFTQMCGMFTLAHLRKRQSLNDTTCPQPIGYANEQGT